MSNVHSNLTNTAACGRFKRVTPHGHAYMEDVKAFVRVMFLRPIARQRSACARIPSPDPTKEGTGIISITGIL